MKLGVLASHPIQYQAPWFRALAKVVELEVFFCHQQSAAEQGKAGFGVDFDWDVDLYSGYQNRFLKNVSMRPGVNRFAGCDTPEIRDVIRAGKFDAFIVCGWYLKSYGQAIAACRAAGVPVLVRGDSHLLTPRPLYKRLAMEFTQRRLLRQFDGFLSVGQRHREYLEHFGVSPEKIYFAPHFVDNEWFAEKAEKAEMQKAEIRKAWGAGTGEIVALFVGKFTPEKRPQDVLHAVRKLPNALAVFIGAGQMETELRALAARLGVRVHFAGFQNQSALPPLYAAANVLVLPSASETWGLVVNEAMACGTPAVVAETVGCAPDLIAPGETGFTFRSGDRADLAAQLGRVREVISGGGSFNSAVMRKIQDYRVEAAVRATLQGCADIARRMKQAK